MRTHERMLVDRFERDYRDVLAAATANGTQVREPYEAWEFTCETPRGVAVHWNLSMPGRCRRVLHGRQRAIRPIEDTAESRRDPQRRFACAPEVVRRLYDALVALDAPEADARTLTASFFRLSPEALAEALEQASGASR
ncbi:MAG: hypothetical protein HOW73_32875 [Polyangiaceae bacterium]|nr:hypothetical protein [Polyangiaceae bacterium]